MHFFNASNNCGVHKVCSSWIHYGKKRRVIWHRGESEQCNWQLQQLALTIYPRYSKFVPVKGSDCSQDRFRQMNSPFIFPLLLPAKYSQFNSSPRITRNRELNPFLRSLRQILFPELENFHRGRIAIFMVSGNTRKIILLSITYSDTTQRFVNWFF